MAYTLSFGLLCLGLILTYPAQAEELEDLQMRGDYMIDVSAIPVGKVKVLLDEKPSHYSAYTKIRTTGVVDVIKRHRREAWAQGWKQSDGYQTEAYRYKSADGKKRKIVMHFDRQGILKKRTNTPEDNHTTRPAVLDKHENDSFDPISAALQLRYLLHQVMQLPDPEDKAIMVPVYDGRRYMHLIAAIHGEATIVYNDIEETVIMVQLSREPIDGYTQKELDTFKELEDPEVYVYFRPSDYVPIKFEIPLDYVRIDAVWAAEAPKVASN